MAQQQKRKFERKPREEVKDAMTLDLPERAQIDTGIIPNTPISREAYIVIRDSLIR